MKTNNYVLYAHHSTEAVIIANGIRKIESNTREPIMLIKLNRNKMRTKTKE